MSAEARRRRSTANRVVGTRDVAALLRSIGRADLDAADAVNSGVLVSEKVEGVWLFAASENALAEAAQRVHESAASVCRSWLLAPTPPLVGTVSKQVAGLGVSRDVVQARLRAELRSGDLRGLPMLTQQYQPYFAVFHPDDQPEIDRQLAAVRSQLVRTGAVRSGGLPDPNVPREYRAWRSNVLQHAEYLGLGRLVDGTLIGWRR